MSAGVADAGAEFFDKEITDFSIDSRSVRPGELFFALSQEDYVRAGFNGAFHDGHQFIESAFERGAGAAVARIDRVAADHNLQRLKGCLLLVDDAIAALQTLPHGVDEARCKPLGGITGRSGRSTVQA